jgi:hypothetical protein
MHSVKLTMAKYLLLIFVALGIENAAFSQENSPLSRYGLGDIVPSRNIASRGMGGIAAGFSESQSINFVNPASLANLNSTIFDLGGEVDIRTIKSTTPANRFTSVNTLFSYLQLGFPVASQKMQKKRIAWGMSVGLRPVTRINYKIEDNKRLPGIDSLQTLYEGDGGVNQAFIGTAIKIKGFSVGIDAGYTFGSKNYSTRLTFIDDTVNYYRSNTANKTTFGGFFISGGIQYDIVLKDKNALIRLGAYGSLQQNLKAKRDDVRETFYSDDAGANYRIDSVYEKDDVAGTIKYPSTIGVGATYQDAHWLMGADVEMTNWANYRYYGTTDNVQNTFTIRAGAQYYPAKDNTPVKKYFNFVKYRAGFYYGSDYIKLNSSTKPEYGFTIGTGMPLTSLQRLGYDIERSLVILNTALEVGSRGSKVNNLRENVIRFSIGLSMNATWFRKAKYN